MQNSGEIIASDIDPTRLERVAENCARLGVTCVRTVPADELDPLLETDSAH
jgi:16S rRNA (cytosine967-C5)-methyltransferase